RQCAGSDAQAVSANAGLLARLIFLFGALDGVDAGPLCMGRPAYPGHSGTCPGYRQPDLYRHSGREASASVARPGPDHWIVAGAVDEAGTALGNVLADSVDRAVVFSRAALVFGT